MQLLLFTQSHFMVAQMPQVHHHARKVTCTGHTGKSFTRKDLNLRPVMMILALAAVPLRQSGTLAVSCLLAAQAYIALSNCLQFLQQPSCCWSMRRHLCMEILYNALQAPRSKSLVLASLASLHLTLLPASKPHPPASAPPHLCLDITLCLALLFLPHDTTAVYRASMISGSAQSMKWCTESRRSSSCRAGLRLCRT